MIVVNDIPFSTDVWEWYNIKRKKFNLETTKEHKIYIFKPIIRKILKGSDKMYNDEKDNDADSEYDFSEDDNGDEVIVDKYFELSPAHFWYFLNELMMVFSDISTTFKLDPKYTLNQVKQELLCVEDVLVYWAITKNHEESVFEGMDVLYVSSENGMNMRYQVKSCFIMGIINDGFKLLEKTMIQLEKKEMMLMDYKTDTYEDINDIQKYIIQVIKNGYAGDLDEFILECILNIQTRTMTIQHENLALIKGYELFQNTEFNKKVPPQEIWRRLFPNYFDGIEDVFQLFFKNMKGECVMFLFNDYLQENFGIKRIPIYNCYTNDNGNSFTYNVLKLLEKQKIRTRIKELYG